MSLKRIFLFVLLVMASHQLTIAQEAPGTWEVGVMAGGAGYIGDLNQNNPLKLSGLSAGAYVKRNFNAYLGARLNYTYGNIKADDANSSNAQFRDRNLRFKTPLNEISALLDFNFFGYRPELHIKQFTPYLFAGVGFVNFKPTIKFEGDTYRLDKLKTEGQDNAYNNTVLTIPYGLGLRYNYKDTWCIFTEIGYRTAYTDYLDDVSGKYPTKQVIIENNQKNLNLSDPSVNKIGYPGTQRGDFRKRDTYLFVSIGISFTFVTSKCYSF